MIPGGISYFLGKLFIASGMYERLAPGATAFVIGRERYIDDLLQSGGYNEQGKTLFVWRRDLFPDGGRR